MKKNVGLVLTEVGGSDRREIMVPGKSAVKRQKRDRQELPVVGLAGRLAPAS